MATIIRTFQPGDEAAQISIYNEASAHLAKFKPASLDEMRRRCRAADFDPTTRFFAVVDGQPVGYASFHANGRVSYPWCRKGREDQAEPLVQAVLQAMQQRGMPKAFAAYRADWQAQQDFFVAHDFRMAREMANYWIDPVDMPTPAARRNPPIHPAHPRDVPEIFNLVPQALCVSLPSDLERHLFHNPYFAPDSVFVLRSRAEGTIAAAGILVVDQAYADPQQVDASMPCFRLGAFGTEGMQTKRINGLFSFLAKPGRDFNTLGLNLLGHAVFRMHNTDLKILAAQVPSDVPQLYRFYQDHFRRQGSFPVLERTL
jgi:hypothetical protein